MRDNKNDTEVRETEIETVFVSDHRYIPADIIRLRRSAVVQEGSSLHLDIIIGRVKPSLLKGSWNSQTQNFDTKEVSLPDEKGRQITKHIDEVQATIVIGKDGLRQLYEHLKHIYE